MTNLVTIHQPNFLPWPGYWLKLALSDTHVIHAGCQLNYSGFTRRVKLYIDTERTKWLSIPLIKGSSTSSVLQTSVLNTSHEQKIFLKKIDGIYKSLPYFDQVRDRLSQALNQLENNPDLASYNQKLSEALVPSLFQHFPKFVMDSSLNLKLKDGPLRLLEICKKLNASKYVSGLGAKKYLNESHFAKSAIPILWFDAASAVEEVFPEVHRDETTIRIISLLGENEFVGRIKEFRVRYRQNIYENFAK